MVASTASLQGDNQVKVCRLPALYLSPDFPMGSADYCLTPQAIGDPLTVQQEALGYVMEDNVWFLHARSISLRAVIPPVAWCNICRGTIWFRLTQLGYVQL